MSAVVIASLKVAVSRVLVAIPAVSSPGLMVVTVGTVLSGGPELPPLPPLPLLASPPPPLPHPVTKNSNTNAANDSFLEKPL
jgi:hypothetical protein